MLQRVFNRMPSGWFWFANILLWLLISVLISTHYYYKRIRADKYMEWIDVWLKTLPDWGTWALFTPIVIAGSIFITLERQTVINFIVKNLAFMIITLLVYWGVVTFEWEIIKVDDFSFEGLKNRYNNIVYSYIRVDTAIYLAIFFVWHLYVFYQKSRRQALHNEQLSRQLEKVELQSLRSQLNPHFLFNTLNSITSLIRLERNSQAITALSELGLMLRRVLENQNNQMTTVKHEIEFINSYLTIQKMRFENKFDYQVDIESACLPLQLPFMILQPLVENAVQHGSQLASNKNTLKLSICCQQNRMKIRLVNKMQEKSDHQGFGIGLKNCRQRMKMLYGDNCELRLTELDDSYCETYLSLPIGEYLD